MIIYVDTTALVKRYVRESSSDELIALLDTAEAVGTAAIAQVEMASALVKAARLNWVERSAAVQSWEDFLTHWQSFTRIGIGTGIIERASRLAWEHELRGYDAVHLAAALVWQQTLNLSILLATYDRDLWKAGKKESLKIWPEDLSSRP
jgi:predicted nucleic acid-binding protein